MQEKGVWHAIHIEEMHCSSCVPAIEQALQPVEVIQDFFVDVASQQAWIELPIGEKDSLQEALKQLKKKGFTAQVMEGGAAFQERVSQAPLLRLVICLLCFIPFLLAMISHWVGASFSLSPEVQLALALLVQAYGAWPFYLHGKRSLLQKRANMDVLVSLGSISAFVLSLYAYVFTPDKPLYFEASVGIIALVLLGRFLEDKAKKNASKVIAELIAFKPKMAFVHRQGEWKTVPASSIKQGETFAVRTGEQIPADGDVLTGVASVDESLLTGESLPIEKKAGSSLIGGSLLLQGQVEACASKSGGNTLLHEMIRSVQQAQKVKAPLQRVADQVSAVFVPIIVVIGMITFLSWLVVGAAWTEAMEHTVSVWLIACPCALGLATPMVITCASGLGARYGLFFKGGAFIEKLAHVSHLCFDKTGTLTKGEPVVADMQLSRLDDQEMQRCISLAATSAHPLAQAIWSYGKEQKITIGPVDQVKETPGQGVVGFFQGEQYAMGSAAFVEQALHLSLNEQATEKTAVFFASKQGVLVTFYFEDPLREEASDVLTKIHSAKIKTFLLSGDRQEVVAKVRQKLQLHKAVGQLSPDEKLATIKRLQREGGCVAMVGDGLNDAPALAMSDIGFCMPKGSAVSLEAADVTLLGGSLKGLVHAFNLSRLANRKIKQNLFFAFIYNCLGVPIAAMGELTPIVAAIAMMCSSLSVVLNALILLRSRLD